MKKMTKWLAIGLLLIAGGLPSKVLASCASGVQSCSSDYEVSETFFGAGGSLNSCSTNYCSKQSAGEVAVGKTASANYAAQAGFNTDREPYLQINVSNTNINLGSLSPSSTKTAYATFTVESYLSHGYTVVNASPPPTNNGYTMTAMPSQAASQAGTEQFGINLVANTDPTTFGANPVELPDSSFASGQVSLDYNDANEYRYVQGDTIAFSQASSSFTTYTISYIFNISHVTPGGTYVLHHVLVATATY